MLKSASFGLEIITTQQTTMVCNKMKNIQEQLKNIKPQPKVEEKVLAVRIRKYNFKTKRYDIIESDWKAPKEEKGK
jgi:hypothetical protein